MRILFFGTHFLFRGEETYVSDEINTITKNYPNVEYLVYTLGPLNNKNSISRYSENVIWIRRKNLKNIKVIWLFVKDMIKIFTRFKPNVIHSIYVIESLIMGILGKIFGVPSILHSRGMDVNYFPFRKLKSNILARVAGKLNNLIITNSKLMKNDCHRLNIPSKKVIALYDGIVLSLFNPHNKDDYKMDKPIEILHLGRFYPEKRQKLIIEVFKELNDKNINFHLTIKGYGPLEAELRSQIKKYNIEDKIEILSFGARKELPELMLKSDLYIQPSLSEGMPLSVLEAMSMNLPVILTKAGGMPELIRNNEGGILIDVDSKTQLYEAILYYLKNPKKIEIDGKRNRKFVLSNFNWDTHAKKLYNIYLKLSKFS